MLPRIEEALFVAERLREAAMSRGIADQLRRACQQLLGVAPVVVEKMERRRDGRDWRRFGRRRRNGGGSRGPDYAVGARLVFAEPVRGPVALGYGCHFGLGSSRLLTHRESGYGSFSPAEVELPRPG